MVLLPQAQGHTISPRRAIEQRLPMSYGKTGMQLESILNNKQDVKASRQIK